MTGFSDIVKARSKDLTYSAGCAQDLLAGGGGPAKESLLQVVGLLGWRF